MTTQYEQAVAELAEAAGAEIEIGNDRVATMMVEGRVVQLKPSDEAESGLTAFTIVANADDDSFAPATLEAALAINLFGSGTDKGHLGLFGDSMFLSTDIALDGISPEQLAESLLAFSRLADDIARQLDGDSASGDAEESLEITRNSGFGGFMQV